METQIIPVVQKQLRDRNRERRVLLIGPSAAGSSYLADRLRAKGCACELATSYEAAWALLRAQEYCVVLSPTRLRDKSLMPLMNLLEGSEATLFYAERVEESCWWLPALRRGVECFGSCAVRPGEFVSMLIETIDGLDPLVAAPLNAVMARA